MQVLCNRAQVRGNGAAIWAEWADRTQFRTCIYEYGNGSNSTAEINGIALQSALKGAQLRTTSLDPWTTGTECKKGRLSSGTFHFTADSATKSFTSVLLCYGFCFLFFVFFLLESIWIPTRKWASSCIFPCNLQLTVTMKESCTLSDKFETICELLSRGVSFGPQLGEGLNGVFFLGGGRKRKRQYMSLCANT